MVASSCHNHHDASPQLHLCASGPAAFLSVSSTLGADATPTRHPARREQSLCRNAAPPTCPPNAPAGFLPASSTSSTPLPANLPPAPFAAGSTIGGPTVLASPLPASTRWPPTAARLAWLSAVLPGGVRRRSNPGGPTDQRGAFRPPAVACTDIGPSMQGARLPPVPSAFATPTFSSRGRRPATITVHTRKGTASTKSSPLPTGRGRRGPRPTQTHPPSRSSSYRRVQLASFNRAERR